MVGDDRFGLEELDRPQSVMRAHSVVIADGQKRQAQPFVADKAHITEETGVASGVDFWPVWVSQQKAASQAAVRAIRQDRAMHGLGQLEIAKGVLVTAAGLLSMGLEAFFFFQPAGDLDVGDHGRPGSFGDGDGVADMVRMPVGNQDEIRLRIFSIQGGARVVVKEWVD